jgi:two-component system, OmpR family, response regulator
MDPVEAVGVKARASDDIEVSIDLALINDSGPLEPDELLAPSTADLTPTPTPAEASAELREALREGRLEDTTVPRLLNAFWLAQETGEIAFERADQRKILYFVKGRPVYGVSNQDTDRLGAIARRVNGLKPADIDRALQIAKDADRPLGEVLVDLGLIDPSRKPELLREQTKSILRGLFAWTTGRYVVGFKTQPPHAQIDLREDLGALIVDGVRDLFELERLQKLLPDHLRLVPSPSAPFQLHDLPLHDAEATLLLRMTGRESIGAILGTTGGRIGERNARAVLYALTCIGVLLPAV